MKKIRDRDDKFLNYKEIRKKEENHSNKTKHFEGFSSNYKVVSERVSNLAKKVLEMSVKSRAGYYKMVDKQKLEQFVFPTATSNK